MLSTLVVFSCFFVTLGSLFMVVIWSCIFVTLCSTLVRCLLLLCVFFGLVAFYIPLCFGAFGLTLLCSGAFVQPPF